MVASLRVGLYGSAPSLFCRLLFYGGQNDGESARCAQALCCQQGTFLGEMACVELQGYAVGTEFRADSVLAQDIQQRDVIHATLPGDASQSILQPVSVAWITSRCWMSCA